MVALSVLLPRAMCVRHGGTGEGLRGRASLARELGLEARKKKNTPLPGQVQGQWSRNDKRQVVSAEQQKVLHASIFALSSND